MIRSKKNVAGDWIIAAFCFILVLICILPIINIAARSLSSADALIKNEVTLFPKGTNLDAYATVLQDKTYTWSFAWTIILTAICTIVSLSLTTMAAYPLIFDKLKGRKLISIFMIFTMYFNAGTIPTYLLLKDLNMLNKPIVLILPYSLSVFNMILMRSFLYSVPDSLRESAQIDGAGPVRILFSVYLPLCTPVLATLALFYAVGRWNGFSDALMFMNNRHYFPIQLLLYNIINSISSVETSSLEGFSSPGLSETLKAATVMFATVPILCIYPFLQKYFIAGVTLGAIKE